MFGWSKKQLPIATFRDARYFLLYRDGRQVCAADATYLIHALGFPETLRADDREFRRIANEDPFIFWNEIRDFSNCTVGFTFPLPESLSFANSALLTDSENVVIEANEVRILLQECDQPKWECVQGFNSEVYQNMADPHDCLMLMFDWSGNRVAFELKNGPNGQRLEAS